MILKNTHILLMVMPFLLCGCHMFSTMKQSKKDSKVIVIKNGNFKALILNPELTGTDYRYGWRFMRAGWIKELYVNGEATSIFRPYTVFQNHPTYGYTHEIVPALDLKTCSDGKNALRLNLGVGIIRQDLSNRFSAEPVRLFPWKTKIKKQDNGKTIIISTQDSGDCEEYAYRMTVKVCFDRNSPVVEFEQCLENTGNKEISASAYVHPFFNALNGFDDCWYILPEQTKAVVAGKEIANVLPRPVSEENVGCINLKAAEIPSGYNWVAAGNFFGKHQRVSIFADRKLEKTVFWRNEKDCFAVEPHIRLKVSTGHKQSWKWFLLIGGKDV